VDYKLINTTYIESVAGGDRETISDLVNLFRDQIREFRQEMTDLLEKKDYYLLGLLAHKAKSSIAIMGMADLAVLLKTFELEAKESRNTENYVNYISRFESDTKNALVELEHYLSNL
jgi:HPt (histidine-containing phosphotransfer) domain-containing protein